MGRKKEVRTNYEVVSKETQKWLGTACRAKGIFVGRDFYLAPWRRKRRKTEKRMALRWHDFKCGRNSADVKLVSSVVGLSHPVQRLTHLVVNLYPTLSTKPWFGQALGVGVVWVGKCLLWSRLEEGKLNSWDLEWVSGQEKKKRLNSQEIKKAKKRNAKSWCMEG